MLSFTVIGNHIKRRLLIWIACLHVIKYIESMSAFNLIKKNVLYETCSFTPDYNLNVALVLDMHFLSRNTHYPSVPLFDPRFHIILLLQCMWNNEPGRYFIKTIDLYTWTHFWLLKGRPSPLFMLFVTNGRLFQIIEQKSNTIKPLKVNNCFIKLTQISMYHHKHEEPANL